ncbi:MAG: hypothetical protein I4N51_03880 [Acinetobacter sp.]|nr:hypothetical protein [Acinetobacter sp.]
MEEVEFTHYGWFGFCPAIFAEIESGAPFIEPRWKILNWWMTVREVCIQIYLNIRSSLDDDFEPMFPLRISGEFSKPIVREFKEDWDG